MNRIKEVFFKGEKPGLNRSNFTIVFDAIDFGKDSVITADWRSGQNLKVVSLNNCNISCKIVTNDTKEWFDQRLGKFTSSRIHELMGIKGLGKTGESYAFEISVSVKK